MPKHYEKIQGYCNFEPLYSQVVDYLNLTPEKKTFLEIGTWLGRSICYFAERVKETNANVDIFAVDTFLGEENATDQQEIVKECGGSIYYKFITNMQEAGVLDIITPLKLTSLQASRCFDNNAVDAIFLDASHLYNDVIDDLRAWWPKVKQGGLFMGHDFYEGTQVKQAVLDFAALENKSVNQWGTCFIIEK
jgi:predicted O-methyltransferase YrrM